MRIKRILLFFILCLLFVFMQTSYGAEPCESRTGKSGLYGSQFDGFSACLYEALENAHLSASNRSVTIRYDYAKGESSQTVKTHVSKVYPLVLRAYLYDHPREFNWAVNSYGGQNYYYHSTYMTATFYYQKSYYYRDGFEDKIEQILTEAVSEIQRSDRYETVKALLEWVCDRASYDYDALEDADEKNFYYSHSQTGILLKGKGVCDGYAKTVKLLCSRLDIPCLIVDGNEHTFNYIKMEDDRWYLLDACWADGKEQIDYSYLLSSNEPYQDPYHTPPAELSIPRTWYLPYEETRFHSYQLVYFRAKDCENPGESILYCEDCQDERCFLIPASGHSDSLLKTVMQKEDLFERIYACSRCGRQRSVYEDCCSIHDWSRGKEIWSEDYSSCTLPYKCSICKKELFFTQDTTKECLEPASCSKSGLDRFTASFPVLLPLSDNPALSDCKSTRVSRSIEVESDRLPHSFVDEVIAPTCTKEGYILHSCSECGENLTDSYRDKLGHSYRKLTILPTCLESGKESKTCKRCGKIVNKTLAALGHDYVLQERKLANCMEGGKNIYGCSRCQVSYEEDIEPTAHVYDEGEIFRKASEEEEGIRLYSCINCGIVRREAIPRLVIKPVKVLFKSTALSNYSLSIVLKWENAGDAHGYYIYRSEDGISFRKLMDLKDGSAESYYDSEGLVNGVCYYYKICAYKKADGKIYKGAASSIKSIYRLSRPIIRSAGLPEAGVCKLSFTRNSKASGVEIRISSNADFSLYQTFRIDSNSKTQTIIKDLKAASVYYIKLRCFKNIDGKSSRSAWSLVRKVKTDF